MESKTLNTIQKVARVGKILSKIVCIFSIVGAVFCLIGAVSLAITDVDTFKIGDVTIHSIVENNANMTVGTMLSRLAVGAILCIGEVIVARKAVKYFKNEIEAGTPFTFDGAKELKKLGIFTIWFPIVIMILADIAYLVINEMYESVADLKIDSYVSIGTGIAFIIVSLLCKYGAEMAEMKE